MQEKLTLLYRERAELQAQIDLLQGWEPMAEEIMPCPICGTRAPCAHVSRPTDPDRQIEPWRDYLRSCIAAIGGLALSEHDGLPCWCRRLGQGGEIHTSACGTMREHFAKARALE